MKVGESYQEASRSYLVLRSHFLIHIFFFMLNRITPCIFDSSHLPNPYIIGKDSESSLGGSPPFRNYSFSRSLWPPCCTEYDGMVILRTDFRGRINL